MAESEPAATLSGSAEPLAAAQEAATPKERIRTRLKTSAVNSFIAGKGNMIINKEHYRG